MRAEIESLAAKLADDINDYRDDARDALLWSGRRGPQDRDRAAARSFETQAQATRGLLEAIKRAVPQTRGFLRRLAQPLETSR